MDAYCEHLGAHLGFGGHVEGEVIECAFTVGSGASEGRNVCIPYEKRPNRGRRCAPTRSWNATSRSTSGTMSTVANPSSTFLTYSRVSRMAAVWPTTARGSLYEQRLELHPQYVLENGVDVEHFKFVHKTPIVPVFTRHDFDEPVSYVDFTITFEGDENQSIDDVNSGVEAINGGLGIAVTKSSGMVDNRTISAVTPVDEHTSDVRFTVYIGRTPGSSDPARRREPKQGTGIRARGHPAVQPGHLYMVAPALFGPACIVAKRVQGLHRDPRVGKTVLSRRSRRQRRGMRSTASVPTSQ